MNTRGSSRRHPGRAFTLIEILLLITLLAILLALIYPAFNGAKLQAKIKVAQAELSQVRAAIEAYHEKRGHYPPDNPGNPALNPLYFELKGTLLKSLNGQPTFITLDGSSQIAVNAVNILFGPDVSGFMNFPKGGGGDEGIAPMSFITNLRPDQIGPMRVGGQPGSALLVCSLRGSSDPAAQVVPVSGDPHAVEAGLNPWRYVLSNPTHNHDSYDLWVDIPIGGKTYRVNNWSKDPERF